MNRGFIISAALHFIICILMIFGLPILFEPKIEPEPLVIAVDVMNIRDISNLPPMPNKPKKKVEPKKVEPPKPEVKKPDKKEVTKNEQPKLAPPEPKKEEVKPPKPVEKKEDKPKKEEKPKEEKKEEKEPTLEDILKTVSKDVEKTQTKETPKAEAPESKSYSEKEFDPAMEISATVRDAIRGQISGCWKFFGGGKDDGTISVTIQIHYNQDGTVSGVKVPITQQAIINTNPSVRNLYNTARNAVLAPECDPLKGLPPSEYNSWKKIEMTFAPTGII